MSDSYEEFLDRKIHTGVEHGFDPIWMPSQLFDFQQSLVTWAIRKGRAAIFADCGLGKGQPIDSPVLTPSGWKAIGHLEVGDLIIASDGKAYPVKGVYPKPVQDTFRVHFSDQSSYVVDLDHLHICRTNNDRQRGNDWRVMSTAELLACSNLRYGANGKSRNYDIPVVSDVEFEQSDLPVDPYVLGALLGDGYMKGNISITSADRQIIDEISLRLPEGVSIEYDDNYNYKIKTGNTGNKRHPFRAALDALGVSSKVAHEKAIPDKYAMASATDRLAMLRGLMDTDGYIAPSGTCQFYSVSRHLADGVVWLLRSLGGIPTRSIKQTSFNGKPGRPCHVITFSLATHNPFLLNRKAKLWNPEPRDNGRWIDRIEFECRQATVCISVDSPDSSYVTQDFIVTHNTSMQLTWAENVVRFTDKPVLILTPLAVSAQTIREGDKFGIECQRSSDGSVPGRIVVTNYERLHLFNPADFV